MTRPRCGKVTFLSGFALPDGTVKLVIDGATYYAQIAERFTVRPGDMVEFRTQGNRAEITAVQVPLLDEPQAQNLFSVGGGQ